MIIAISQRNLKKEKGANMDALENDYFRYYEKFGITLMPIPNVSSSVEEYFKKGDLNGLILSGGNESKEREKTEKKIIKIAIKKKLPIFANCHGMQIINKFFGGSLDKNIKKSTGLNHVASQHKVSIIDPESVKYFKKSSITTNSYHDFGILKKNLSKKLKVFALSEDKSIEGIYHPHYPIAGVMWHPERAGSDKKSDIKLINAFLKRKLFWKK
ncbi:gamma-glutamyl-gamma-aminobutyrate hydrolase family protein [Candidatus Woesearchaeota archaeon]|nr:gamma-glutamyl-gamma-aminobutyrate hydrolase family protein [Candidatus Woesearchaeota archaeon]